MNKETLKALRGSIAHWRRMANGKAHPEEWPQTNDCDLCRAFVLINGHCGGCPVKEKTGQELCFETPYRKAYREFETYGINSPDFKAEAKEELKFLESLLPKKRKKP